MKSPRRMGKKMEIDETLLANSPEYDAFVEKFKPKKTTDECYTPDEVYEAVRNWAVKEYDLHDCEIVRPFYPGGDYEHYNYPQNAVVLDNPPFSILSKICRFYEMNKIKFFLFAPGLTLFNAAAGALNYVITDSRIRYKNGACVNTGFVTNLGTWKIRTAPDLKALIKNAQGGVKNKKIILQYPSNCITAARLGKLCTMEKTVMISENQVSFCRKLDAQAGKSGLFGAGFIISDGAAKQLDYSENANENKIEFSEKEKDIIKELNKYD